MKKGEKVLLNIKPEYAFGEGGKPSSGDDDVVPPNASLQMDLGLVLWWIVSDITKDKKVLMKILKEGEGYERPNDGAMVLGTVLLIKAFKGFCTLISFVKVRILCLHFL
ncbi:peptidyl-prolyl cis-trans isomerase FKBP62-like [Trifolium pratense]|uniref:peptidyl-prolyl cis-trans isomerase FKBP62-like n=1 Tax=Trifolium pratense TaxID=57577 RepID=UPI001E696831|nr:peptidyl-prolyl cis-trans isomerase FKBP62-like [Trifolium pratense]